jgi:predicted metal-binding membrane protein
MVRADGADRTAGARSPRLATIVALGLVVLLCWAWIWPMARDMYGPMTGLSAWMMTPAWDARHLFLLWLMWAVMMAAMMLPSAMPLLLLYDASQRRRADAGGSAAAVYAMGAGYVLVWALFSVAATVLQRALARLDVLTPMMEMHGRTAIGLTLLLAGVYQLTPWKAACLRQCRSPLTFVMQRWRRGAAGALRMGVEHGAYCLGCCWALMLLLFAGGVMNLAVIVGLTTVIAIEKLAPIGDRAALAVGVVLVAAALWMLAT